MPAAQADSIDTCGYVIGRGHGIYIYIKTMLAMTSPTAHGTASHLAINKPLWCLALQCGLVAPAEVWLLWAGREVATVSCSFCLHGFGNVQ